MNHSGFLPAGGLGLRLALAVAAVQRGEIPGIQTMPGRADLWAWNCFLEKNFCGMTAYDRIVKQTQAGYFCLAVTERMSGLALLPRASANGTRSAVAEAAAARPLGFVPHGNHGDNNLTDSQRDNVGARA